MTLDVVIAGSASAVGWITARNGVVREAAGSLTSTRHVPLFNPVGRQLGLVPSHGSGLFISSTVMSLGWSGSRNDMFRREALCTMLNELPVTVGMFGKCQRICLRYSPRGFVEGTAFV